jgi:hypothetical protein
VLGGIWEMMMMVWLLLRCSPLVWRVSGERRGEVAHPSEIHLSTDRASVDSMRMILCGVELHLLNATSSHFTPKVHLFFGYFWLYFV